MRKIGTVIAALAAMLALTAATTQPSLARTVGSHEAVAKAKHDRVAKIRAYTVVREYNKKGKLVKVIRHHQSFKPGTQVGRGCSILCTGTLRVGPKAGGTGTATMGYSGQSTLGKTLWDFTVRIKFSWSHTMCPCEMSVINKGHDWDVKDNHWRWAGVQKHSAGWLSGGDPHANYKFMQMAEFDGSDLMGYSVTEYPQVALTAHDDGTFSWVRSCDC